MDDSDSRNVRVLAHSPGSYPILIVDLDAGDLRAVYFETGYDLERSKRVTADWLRDNAIGRHSFVEVNPPEAVPASSLRDFVRGELLEEGS